MRLGDYIREVNVRNKDLKVTNLQGVSISKHFIPSIANTIGTDMSTYKVVNPGQFAYGPVTSRNGDKVSIALYKGDDDAIISQAYTVFEVVDSEQVSSEYLMMWFQRPEFDRYARFHSHGSAREIFDWDELCGVYLPLPDIDRQREIVEEYETLSRRIRLNEQMIEKLEATAQALYRKMFVDGIDKENLPEGWHSAVLGDYCEVITKGTTPTNYDEKGNVKFVKAETITINHSIDSSLFAHIDEDTHNKDLKRSILREDDLLFTIAGTLGKFCIVDKSILPANTNQAVAIIRVDKTRISPIDIYAMFIGGIQEDYCKRNVQQAVQANLSLETISNMPIVIPPYELLVVFHEQVSTIFHSIQLHQQENSKLSELQSLLLAKMGNLKQ